MITCKEDLYGTFIVNDHGELRDLYLGLCAIFGLRWLSGYSALKSEVGFKSKFISVVGKGTISADGMGDMITISDLKQEEKPKRTKVEYVKCEYDGKAANAVMNFESNAPLYKMVNDKYWSIDELDSLFSAILDDACIYRRIETEITERQEFIIELATMGEDTGITNTGLEKLAAMLYDSGKFKLVEGE